MIRLLESLRRSLRLLVGKCVIEAAEKSSDGINVDFVVLGNERHSGVRLMQHYGFASVPKSGSHGVALFVGGARDDCVLVASQGAPSGIPSLDAGEVALFSEFGQKVVLDKNGNVDVFPASGKDILFNGRVIAKNGLVSEGDVLAVGEVTAKVVKVCDDYTDATAVHLSTHTHPVSGGSTTGPVPGS